MASRFLVRQHVVGIDQLNELCFPLVLLSGRVLVRMKFNTLRPIRLLDLFRSGARLDAEKVVQLDISDATT